MAILILSVSAEGQWKEESAPRVALTLEVSTTRMSQESEMQSKNPPWTL
jgi:hypothetical protein